MAANPDRISNVGSGPYATSSLPVPRRRYWLFLVVTSVSCYADLLSKRLVFSWRGMPGEQPIWWLWPNFVGIETSLNTGALFGIGHGQVWFFAIFSAVALVGLVCWFVYASLGHDRLLTLILAGVAGGILGNLYDRLGLWSLPTVDGQRIYAVRDWIRLSWGEHVWPNFNLADSLLVCGAGLLVCHSFWVGRTRENEPKDKLGTEQAAKRDRSETLPN